METRAVRAGDLKRAQRQKTQVLERRVACCIYRKGPNRKKPSNILFGDKHRGDKTIKKNKMMVTLAPGWEVGGRDAAREV